MTTHPPRHRIEELLAGSQQDAALRAHVDACAECTTRLSAMEKARAAFVARRDPSGFAKLVVEQRSKSKKSPSLRYASYALAAAAVVLLGVRMAIPEPTAIRFKGKAKLQVFVQRNGHVESVEDGEALTAGDHLAFVYTLAEPQNLLLISIDESGATTRYFPSEAHGAQLPPAARAQLPVGIELDGHRGEERLLALFSREPIDEARATQALQAALREANARDAGIAGMRGLSLPAEQSSTWFRKP